LQDASFIALRMEINALLGAFQADPRETSYQREVFRVVLRNGARVPGRYEGLKLPCDRAGPVLAV